MRKILGILVIVAAVVLVASAAAAQAVEQPGAGQTNAFANGSAVANGTALQLQNQTTNTNQPMGTGVQQHQQEKEQLKNELQLRIVQKQQQLDGELANMTATEQTVYRNQNAVRLAVHTFLAMGEVDGGIGQNVSAIARDYNNSIQASIRAEERIESRSGFVRFFAGGDEGAAAELERLRLENQERIQELNRLIGDCDCDEETKALLQEQLRNMEEEQIRLRQLAARENADKGLLGWIWK
jgi:opacity protein-like surface antigen